MSGASSSLEQEDNAVEILDVLTDILEELRYIRTHIELMRDEELSC